MLRRIVDIAAAVAALVALSPLLAAVAIAVVIDSPGWPLYRARRCGQDGRPFRMWKFRTMIPGADRVGPAITRRKDPRVTRLGSLLRRTKLDELPQFFNLLLGDVTLVGPRPEAPEIVGAYRECQRAVLGVKPGITGCVQIEAGCEADRIPEEAQAEEYYVRHLMERKLARDLEYLRTRTAWSDARIVLATAAILLRAVVNR
jgi:lipopolysaccharide/colanic/teichoic acid biosynthesis glycosyltransferase